ncbi:MAG: winged helix-turn-helix domain-containing protein [Acidobacteriota bacterium]
MKTGNAFEKSSREILSYEFDDLTLDVKKEELLRKGVPVSITRKAFQILSLLVQNSGQTVEKEDIYQELWADSFVEDANLTQHIYILRKTLGSRPGGDQYIETVAKAGYRFNADVSQVFARPERFSTNGSADQARSSESEIRSHARLTLLRNEKEEFESPDAKPATNSFSKRRQILTALAALGLIAVAGAILIATLRGPSAAPSASGTQRSIAVLPFKTIGEETANEKLGLGMADAVITRIGGLKTIPVRPTSSIFRYTDGPAESSIEAGRQMGVDQVLEGTVQRDSDRVRVSVKLLSVADGSTVWAENFDERFTDIFKMQDSISAKVVRALSLNLTQDQEKSLALRSTNSTEAYEAYQKGIYFGNLRTSDDLQKAVEYFQQAVKADPSYGRAYAMLSDSFNMLAYYRFADPREMRKRASEAAEKAVSLDDNVPETFIALAYLKLNEEGGIKQSKAYLEQAIEIAPFNSTAHVRYGWVLLNFGHLDSAVEQMRLAQEYDPLSAISNGALCDVLAFQGKSDEAVGYCEKSLAAAPELEAAQLALAEKYFVIGRKDEAIALAQRAIAAAEGNGRLSDLGSLGYFYAKSGDSVRAEAIAAELNANAARYPALLNDLTVISYARGDRDEGFAYFQQLYQRRAFAPFRLSYDPIWADVRADERVIKVVGKLPLAMESD